VVVVARIDLTDTTTWKQWQDGQVMTAEDHIRERDTIIAAVNDNYDKIQENNQYILITQLMEVL
jgi:hypothetical protein